jgi:hypothetical protein
VIDAHGLGDRVLSVAAGARLTLIGLTVTGGNPRNGLDAGDPADGGGVLNAGTLAMDTVAIAGNSAGAGGGGAPGGRGGGVFNRGSLTLSDTTVRENVAGAGGSGGAGVSGSAGGSGGGIYNQGELVVTASAIYDNRAGAGGVAGADASGGEGGAGGGIFSSAGSLRVSDTTLFHNFAGAGGGGGGATGAGGNGGSGGAIAAVAAPAVVRYSTVADNGAGAGGAPGPITGQRGAGGLGGGLFVQSSTLTLENSIVAANLGSGCAGDAIANAGHDLTDGDGSCPGRRGNPRLGPLHDNGGPTPTMAIAPGSAAIDRVPDRSGNCPATDQRGVRRPQGRACDIGAYEFTLPSITIGAPSQDAFYVRGTRVLARFSCGEGGVTGAIARCEGSVAQGHAIPAGRPGTARFVVTAIDTSGNRTRKSIDYVVFEYVNPLREVRGLTRRRIDLGVDYAGSGPLLAIGRGVVTFASDTDSGPPSCWAISCWPGGGIVVYRLLDGPFAGKYLYVAEHITVNVRAGQTISPGQQIATLYSGYPWSEWGWAAGPGPEALAMADGHRCPCSDPGDWSTIDGRTMNSLLVGLGAPSGYLQANTPNQGMPRGWPTWPG